MQLLCFARARLPHLQCIQGPGPRRGLGELTPGPFCCSMWWDEAVGMVQAAKLAAPWHIHATSARATHRHCPAKTRTCRPGTPFSGAGAASGPLAGGGAVGLWQRDCPPPTAMQTQTATLSTLLHRSPQERVGGAAEPWDRVWGSLYTPGAGGHAWKLHAEEFCRDHNVFGKGSRTHRGPLKDWG